MAGTLAILSAAARLVWREIRSFSSIRTNNFFLFALLLMLQPASAAFFLTTLGAIVFVLISEDPLSKVGARMGLWPLSRGGKLALRVAAFGLSPVVWLAFAASLAARRLLAGLEIVAAAAAVQAAAALAGRLRFRSSGRIPVVVSRVPGCLWSLAILHARAMLVALDTYAALLVALAAACFRFSNVDPEAFPVMACVAALIMSTQTQCLFSMEGQGAKARYRLYPLLGWRILLAKDLGFLAVLGLLAAPLDLLPALAAGTAALACGHRASVLRSLPQLRYRFSGGVLPDGLIQILVVFGAGMSVHRAGPAWLLAPLPFWLLSLWWYGRMWDRLSRAPSAEAEQALGARAGA